MATIPAKDAGASAKISKRIQELADWRGARTSLEGNTRRAIDLRAEEQINAAALKQLFRAAVAANTAAVAARSAKKKK